MNEPARTSGHLAGFIGPLPPDAGERAKRAVQQLVDGAPAIHEEPGLVVAVSPSDGLIRTASRVCAVAGELFERDALSERLGVHTDSSAAQVIEAAFARWGEAAFTNLRSEACVFIWDGARRQGLIARDQLGASSLYWCNVGGAVAFATELRALLGLLPTTPGPDPMGVAHWLRRQTSRADLTLFEGIRQVPAGHRLEIGSERVRVVPYWQPAYEPPMPWTYEEAVEHLRPALLRAVGRRLSRTGLTGILLSGGLDSACVAGFARGLAQDRLCAYSAVFPGQPRLDESPWIDPLVESLELPGVRLAPEPRGILLETLQFVRSWSVPPSGFDFWTTPLREQAAADGATVLLTGDAADEIFATRLRLMGDRLRRGRVLSAYRLARSVPNLWFYPPPRLLAQLLWEYGVVTAAPWARAVSRHLPGRDDGEPPWLRDETVQLLPDSAEREAWRKLAGPRWWADAVHHHTVRAQVLGLLDDNRRIGQSVGLAMRSPLLDLDVVELALKCPPELGFGTTLSKPLLRTAARGYIPDSVRLRPLKTAFNTLLIEGLHGPDRLAIESLLRDPNAEVGAYVHRDVLVRDLLDEAPPAHDPRAWSWALDLLRVTVLEVWLRQQADPGFADNLLQAGKLPSRRYRLWRVPQAQQASLV